MAQNWEINPATGDYVMSGGSPVQTDSLKVPAYFRVKTRRGKWLYAPDNKFGSDFYAVQKRPSDNANKRFENIAVSALQPMVDDGRALEIDVKVVENQRSGTGLQVTILDASGEVAVETLPGLGL